MAKKAPFLWAFLAVSVVTVLISRLEFERKLFQVAFKEFHRGFTDSQGSYWVSGDARVFAYFDQSTNALHVEGAPAIEAGSKHVTFVTREHIWFLVYSKTGVQVYLDGRFVQSYEGLEQFQHSSRGKRHLVVTSDKKGKTVWIDGKKQDGVWAEVHYITFVGESEFPEYSARKIDGTYAVRNSKSFGPFEQIKTIVHDDSGSEIAIVAKHGKKWSVFWKDKSFGGYDWIHEVCLSSSGDKVGFSATKGQRLIIFDGQERASEYVEIKRMAWSSDGTLSYLARDKNQQFVIWGEKKSTAFQWVAESRVLKDGRFTRVTLNGHDYLHIFTQAKETLHGPFEKMSEPTFGHAFGHFGAVCLRDGNTFVQVGSKTLGPYLSAGPVSFGPGEADTVFFAEVAQHQYTMVKDGEEVYISSHSPSIPWIDSLGLAHALVGAQDGPKRHVLSGNEGRLHQYFALSDRIAPDRWGIYRSLVYEGGAVRRLYRWSPKALFIGLLKSEKF